MRFREQPTDVAFEGEAHVLGQNYRCPMPML